MMLTFNRVPGSRFWPLYACVLASLPFLFRATRSNHWDRWATIGTAGLASCPIDVLDFTNCGAAHLCGLLLIERAHFGLDGLAIDAAAHALLFQEAFRVFEALSLGAAGLASCPIRSICCTCLCWPLLPTFTQPSSSPPLAPS